MSEKNLGTVQALISSTNAPTNIKLLWYDENVNILKYYNIGTAAWEAVAGTNTGQIRLESTDSLGYLADKIDDVTIKVVGGVLVASVSGGGTGDMLAANNLSDVADAETSRDNLDVYSTTQVGTLVSYKLSISQNLNDLNNKGTSRTNLDVYSKGEVITIANTRLTVSNNLSDVGSAITSFNNIKQVANMSYAGVIEIATNDEVIAGGNGVLAVTPAGLTSKTGGIITKIIDIGDWDMNTDSFISVLHGVVDFTKIRSISVIIRNDTNVNYYSLTRFVNGVDVVVAGVNSILETTINLGRADGSIFDSSDFTSTSYNRGYITIGYIN